MEKVKLPIHEHPLLPITRFFSSRGCNGCGSKGYIYGGYRCNELGCETPSFHKECAESLPEITHSSHPDHPLKLQLNDKVSACNQCGIELVEEKWIYMCSICDFKLDLHCAKEAERSHQHEHPLKLTNVLSTIKHYERFFKWRECKTCDFQFFYGELCYECFECKEAFHEECAKFFPEANHSSHPQHPLKFLSFEAAPDYVDERCLLCEEKFDQGSFALISKTFHHCDVCNFSICTACMKNPPPVLVESPTTHEHQLHLVPRHMYFICNACGRVGGHSPYFCVQCNFMIHRQCIDLPRVININRHDHRISYTTRLGHGKWICKVCRNEVDGFYGAYTCVKCPSFAVHSRCATREDIWDMIELEGMPDEDDEVAPFEVIDDNTIKHFSHDHNLQINKDGHFQILLVCEACVLQILSEPFYSCKQCNFILHEKCANHPRKKRHVYNNLPFTLLISDGEVYQCWLCSQDFTGFRYKSGLSMNIDVRCAAISDTLEHGSHQHSLYYSSNLSKRCNRCEMMKPVYRCDECDYGLENQCALLPNKVMRIRYDDHPLILSFGDTNVASEYWCEACETKVNPKEWFYTCNDCGTTLHISCVVGDFSYIKPGSRSSLYKNTKVVSNTSSCRPICSGCNSRCKLLSVLKISKALDDVYICSLQCLRNYIFLRGGNRYVDLR
ncbi:hypothetical protein CARUB_v10006270mg [Capsella rubella]|uniref:Zinc finger PHD-type domain-containing protein n=1 Tax=Capsella rubella TaxID=81985 RepID=R0GZW0_9BRAS|nr:uncharacterized protein LOC17878121 [Capsella rubella]EOA17865.1 hypothetical protein CARUB_v10006270mg [Capsella rubella]